MFKKILIANRGEIALRIICACRELGIKTVAVYSEADENSLHVRFADEDVCIGPARSADSYLSVPAVLSAAEITGADAIHPGYGFLSESAYLAEVCEACHIKFIGPAPNVIRLLGDKARARRAMKKAGVPILPGSDGPVDGEEKALEDRARISAIPVIIKAVAGGGGRGMRVIRARRRAGKALKTAQREAEAAFGVGDVYLEKYVENPRHIEFQVLGDHHGAVVHLGERECSIQRRHQKLLEEAPSVAVTEKMRRKLGSTVVDAARAVQYTNAGTFEFLLDDKGNFYFLEVNTRLQVEHPVTEFITGVDIVKEQIRIAAGERLSFKQGDVTFTGHAIECRINAEDPDTFAPSPGVIHAFSVPGGPGVRVDTFAHSECTIPPYYDSMIAKIIVHGRDRQEAIARMRRTLEMTVIEGHQDVDSAAPADPRRAGFRRRPPEHVVHGALHRRRRSRRLTEPPRRSRLSVGRSRSAIRLSPIDRMIATSAPQRRHLDARRRIVAIAPACAAARRSLQLRDKCRSSAARFLDARPSASSPPRATRRRAGHRQRSRRHRARCRGADGVHVGQDDLDVADGARRSSAGRDRRRSRRTTREQIDAALETDAELRRRRSGLRDGTKDTGYSARGLELVALRRGPRQAGGRDRRHHARARRCGRSRPAPSAVAVITDLLVDWRRRSARARVRRAPCQPIRSRYNRRVFAMPDQRRPAAAEALDRCTEPACGSGRGCACLSAGG